MSEIEHLQKWMDEHNMTVADLAREIAMSYDGLYQSLKVRRNLSAGVKVRLIQRFGTAVVSDALGVAIEPNIIPMQ